MSKIEIGEYVRTENGIIGKIIDLDIDMGICLDSTSKPITIDALVKHSKNIVNLIEEGDYVNRSKVVGFRIDREDSNKRFGVIVEVVNSNFTSGGIDTEDIKSLVTKEQFRNIEFKVGGFK